MCHRAADCHPGHMQNAPFLIGHAPEIILWVSVTTVALAAALSPDERRLRRVLPTVG
jgi:hypothetical protein